MLSLSQRIETAQAELSHAYMTRATFRDNLVEHLDALEAQINAAPALKEAVGKEFKRLRPLPQTVHEFLDVGSEFPKKLHDTDYKAFAELFERDGDLGKLFHQKGYESKLGNVRRSLRAIAEPHAAVLKARNVLHGVCNEAGRAFMPLERSVHSAFKETRRMPPVEPAPIAVKAAAEHATSTAIVPETATHVAETAKPAAALSAAVEAKPAYVAPRPSAMLGQERGAGMFIDDALQAREHAKLLARVELAETLPARMARLQAEGEPMFDIIRREVPVAVKKPGPLVQARQWLSNLSFRSPKPTIVAEEQLLLPLSSSIQDTAMTAAADISSELPVASKGAFGRLGERLRGVTARFQGLGEPNLRGPVTHIGLAPLEPLGVRVQTTYTPPATPTLRAAPVAVAEVAQAAAPAAQVLSEIADIPAAAVSSRFGARAKAGLNAGTTLSATPLPKVPASFLHLTPPEGFVADAHIVDPFGAGYAKDLRRAAVTEAREARLARGETGFAALTKAEHAAKAAPVLASPTLATALEADMAAVQSKRGIGARAGEFFKRFKRSHATETVAEAAESGRGTMVLGAAIIGSVVAALAYGSAERAPERSDVGLGR